MCNRLPEIKKNGDAGIFPVYYSLKGSIKCHYYIRELYLENNIRKIASKCVNSSSKTENKVSEVKRLHKMLLLLLIFIL